MTTQPASKILVIDDDSDILDFVVDLLQEEVSVSFTSEGAKAMGLAKLHKPDLILLDVMMPGMDGFEVCKSLKADPETQHIPIVFLTGKKDNKDIAEGLGLGAVDYIVKPFDAEIVATRIRNFLKQISATRDSSKPDQEAGVSLGQSTDRRAAGAHRPDRTPKNIPKDTKAPDHLYNFVELLKVVPLSRVLLFALFFVIIAGAGISAFYSLGGNQKQPPDTVPYFADLLELNVSAQCRASDAALRITNIGKRWPSSGEIRIYRLGSETVLLKRRVLLAKDQSITFMIGHNELGSDGVGVWVKPSWHNREFKYDATVNCG